MSPPRGMRKTGASVGEALAAAFGGRRAVPRDCLAVSCGCLAVAGSPSVSQPDGCETAAEMFSLSSTEAMGISQGSLPASRSTSRTASLACERAVAMAEVVESSESGSSFKNSETCNICDARTASDSCDCETSETLDACDSCDGGSPSSGAVVSHSVASSASAPTCAGVSPYSEITELAYTRVPCEIPKAATAVSHAAQTLAPLARRNRRPYGSM
jgi:hypothetical protein